MAIFVFHSRNFPRLHRIFERRCFSCSSLSLVRSHKFSLFGKADSSRWIRRQITDPFVKKANHDAYRCRSAYKLIEIDNKFHFLNPGKVIIDCGASPGSWTQVAVERVLHCKQDYESRGQVIAVDILDIAPVPGALILDRCDFTDSKTRERISNAVPQTGADVVMSDMAPNATGNHEIDHERIMDLCEVAFNFSKKILSPGGVFLCKIWDGRETQDFVRELGGYFQAVRRYKPEASRKESAELYLVANGYKGSAV